MFFIKFLRLFKKLQNFWADWSGRSGQVYVEQRVDQYRNMWRAIAREIGAEFEELATDLWELRKNGQRTRIMTNLMEFDNPVILAMADRKPLIHKLLRAHDVAIPEHEVFCLNTLDKACAFLQRFPEGIVIKPANGYGGKGVTTHILGPKEAKVAAILASLYANELLLEQMIPGECYRLLVLDGNMIHAVKRAGPRVIGDGESTVQQLIDTENARRRLSGERELAIDRDSQFTLDYQGYSMNSIPAAYTSFIVKSVNDSDDRNGIEVRTVYNEDVTDQVCNSIRNDAEKVALLLGSRLIGVDIITRDISVPLKESGGTCNEVNTTPALHHHYNSKNEEYPQAGLLVAESLLSPPVQ